MPLTARRSSLFKRRVLFKRKDTLFSNRTSFLSNQRETFAPTWLTICSVLFALIISYNTGSYIVASKSDKAKTEETSADHIRAGLPVGVDRHELLDLSDSLFSEKLWKPEELLKGEFVPGDFTQRYIYVPSTETAHTVARVDFDLALDRKGRFFEVGLGGGPHGYYVLRFNYGELVALFAVQGETRVKIDSKELSDSLGPIWIDLNPSLARVMQNENVLFELSGVNLNKGELSVATNFSAKQIAARKFKVSLK